jgi:hypothetical protein
MIKQKGLGTQLSSIDGSDPPEAQAGPLSEEPVDEAIQAALAYAKKLSDHYELTLGKEGAGIWTRVSAQHFIDVLLKY